MVIRRIRQLLEVQETPTHPGWPTRTSQVMLQDGSLVNLRPLARGDASAWRRYRLADEQLIRPVEPTVHGKWEEAHTTDRFMEQLAMMRRLAAAGIMLPLAIDVDGSFSGQLTVGGIERGASSSCWLGYWVSSIVQGRGVAQAAVALAADHIFDRVGLHRITATYLPDNPASARVLQNVGFRREGELRRNLHIDGQWRDHVQVSLLHDDYVLSAQGRLQRQGKLRY